MLEGTPEDRELLDQVCSLFYLQPRGSNGEFSPAEGAKFDISNRLRVGLSEVMLIQKMIDGISKVCIHTHTHTLTIYARYAYIVVLTYIYLYVVHTYVHTQVIEVEQFLASGGSPAVVREKLAAANCFKAQPQCAIS
jgi:hypothetical protein